MRSKLLAGALASTLIPFAASAEVPYNFAEFDYRNMDGDLDGFGARASVVIVPQLHLLGDAYRITTGPERRDQGSLALGWHQGFMPGTDLVLRGGWTRVRDRVALNGNGIVDEIADIFNGDEVTQTRDDGFLAQAGLRSMVTEEIELHGYLQYEDVLGGNAAVALGGVYNFTPNFGLSGLVELGEDDTIYELGLRFTFDGARFGLPER